MELIVLVLVFLAYSRGSKMSGKGDLIFAFVGSFLYVFTHMLVQVALSGAVDESPRASSTKYAVAMFFSLISANVVSTGLVLVIARKAFPNNPFRLFDFFIALNAAFILFGLTVLASSSAENVLTPNWWAMASIPVLFALTLLYGTQVHRNKRPPRPIGALLILFNLAILLSTILSVFSASYSSPVAFYLIGIYFSVWLFIVTGLNVAKLLPSLVRSKVTISPPQQ